MVAKQVSEDRTKRCQTKDIGVAFTLLHCELLAKPIARGAPLRRGPEARDAPVVTVSWGFTQLSRTATNDTSEAADWKCATVELHRTCQRALQPLLSAEWVKLPAEWVKLHVQKHV
jgi:hypothetical protein